MCCYLVSICVYVCLVVSGPILYMYTPLQNSCAFPKIRRYTELPRGRTTPNPSTCPPIQHPVGSNIGVIFPLIFFKQDKYISV